MPRKRIYVAGPYSAPDVIQVLDNMRRGMRACTELLLRGYAPFCPWSDYHFSLMLHDDRGEAITKQDYYEYSLAWLEAAEAVYVLPNSEESRGTQAEITRAIELGIPVIHNMEALEIWRKWRATV